MIYAPDIEDILGPEDPIEETLLRYSVGSGTNFGHATNVKSTWGKLCAELSKPLLVTESRADFDRLPREQQTQLKARAGWFVGAPVANRHRRKANILKRQFLTLDGDAISPALSAAIRAGNDPLSATGTEWMWHTTTRHTNDKPRLRLVILLNRLVGVAEYWKLVRCVAAKIEVSMELRMISPESERPAQLMFYPVQLHGQKFEHGRHHGEPLDVDRLLAEFPFETPSGSPTTLPMFKGEKKIRVSAEKAGDPHQKPGEIGAFCRTYDVEQAIAVFLPDVFEQCGNRYRYFAAEGADGAVVYDDGKFFYSHHGSDPYRDQCLNAWDLVRCHLFGELDGEDEENGHCHVNGGWRAGTR